MAKNIISLKKSMGMVVGSTSQEIGNTNNKLNMLDPNILPITMSECPFLINAILDTNSGNDVPSATATTDKNVDEIPNN